MEFASIASRPQHAQARSCSSSLAPHALQNLTDRSMPLGSTTRSRDPVPADLPHS